MFCCVVYGVVVMCSGCVQVGCVVLYNTSCSMMWWACVVSYCAVFWCVVLCFIACVVVVVVVTCCGGLFLVV